MVQKTPKVARWFQGFFFVFSPFILGEDDSKLTGGLKPPPKK